MGTFRMSKDFIEYVIVSQTSQSGDYLALNLKNRLKPKRAWRSSDTSQQEIVIDLLSARNNPEVHVEITNAPAIRFIGGDDGSTFNGFDSGNITMKIDPKQGVYRYGGPLTGFNHRYVKVVVPTGSPTDGAAFFSIGTLSFMASTELMVLNPEQGVAYGEAGSDGFLVNDFESGGSDVYDLTVLRPLTIEMSIRQPFKDGSSPMIWDMFRSKATIVYVNFGLGESWQAYLVRRVSGLREARDSFSYVRFDTLEVALVV